MIVSAQITLGEGSTYIGGVPVNLFNNYSYSQQIYTKQEINAATAGNITGLKFYMKPSGDLNGATDWVVYLGHTSKTSFANVNEVIPVGQLTKVYSGTVDNINGVVEMTFDVPFSYNNTENLVVSVHENNPANGYNTEAFYVYEPEPDLGRSILFRSKNSIDISNPPMVLGTVYYYKPVVTLMGLTPHSIPLCPSVIYPEDNENLVKLTPEIKWYPTQGTIHYKVSIGTTPGGTDVVNQQIVNTTSFTPSTSLSYDTTYYLKVVSVGAGGESSSCNVIKFKTVPPPPVNDACTGALIASVPYSYTQLDAGGATNNNGFITVCSDGMNDGTWFKFTGDGSIHEIKVTMPTGSSFDAKIGVYKGICDNLACVNTVDNSGAGGTETVSIPTAAGVEYYVNVGYYSATEDKPEDVFTITINNGNLGVSEISKDENNFKVYPNPFTELLNIVNAGKIKSISVSEFSGRLIKTIENPSSQLRLGDLKQGVYLLILNMKDGSKQTFKVIKK
jgi:hypothetical protein